MNGSSSITKSAGVASRPPAPELDAFLQISEDAFAVYDAAGLIRFATSPLRHLLDLTESEWAGLQNFPALSRLLTGRLADKQFRLRPPWELWHPGNGAGRERLALAEGERILERVVRPMLDRSGRPSGWLERYRDLTAECKLPDRLLQTDKLAALGQLVAGIAHELNNPLTAVMGYGHLLLERPLDAKALADAHHICQEAERAARIVRSLLMLARQAKLDKSPIQLNEIVDRTLLLCSYDLRRAGIAVEVDLHPQLPPTLANPVQLQQVVLNLLVNSQQAIAEAGRPGRIALRTRYAKNHVFLDVEDNGAGIPAELQSRIFEPFFTTKPVGVGTGLGLSIVSGILRQHDAEIQVLSEPGRGATFTVSLPQACVPKEFAERREPETRRRVSPRRILVAEEEPGVGRMILDALTAEGHRVELVSDETELLRRVGESAYDLVICDWWMPRLNGPELCRALTASGGACNEHLLLITSDPAMCSASEFLRRHKFACLAKPFLLSELKGAVARLIERQGERLVPVGEPAVRHPSWK